MPTNRPDITRAQIVAILLAGVPILSNLLAAFGVYHPSPEQQKALQETIQWGSIAAGLLIAGDAGIRHARNRALASTQEAVIYAQATAANASSAGPIEGVRGELGTVDEEDFTQQPPDASSPSLPEQPGPDAAPPVDEDPAASGPDRPTAA